MRQVHLYNNTNTPLYKCEQVRVPPDLSPGSSVCTYCCDRTSVSLKVDSYAWLSPMSLPLIHHTLLTAH